MQNNRLQPPLMGAFEPNNVPMLSEFQLNLTQEEDDDAEEEKNMMAILLKLKSAQSSMNESRKRKKSKQLADDAVAKYSNDVKDVLARHNKRWAAKISVANQKSKKLKMMAEEGIEKSEANRKFCSVNIEKHTTAVEAVLQGLMTLERECSNTQTDNRDTYLLDIAQIRSQVTERLNQMREMLIKTHNQSSKDDRFTKVIKSFLVNF